MSNKNILANPALKSRKEIELNEEWNNFMKRVGGVANIVKDMSGDDKEKAEAAKTLADKYLEGKIITDDNIELKVKSDRTVINDKAFRSLDTKDENEIDKNAWMAEVAKDADKRAHDRKIRKERADTWKTKAVKAFRRGEYDKALSCYNHAIDEIKDNPMFYCDRALTNIKLGNFEKVFSDCDWALRLNDKSFKARLYKAKAHKQLEEYDKLEKCRSELDEMFPQHNDLISYFLDKKEGVEEDDDDDDN